jgi:hypothetical protein
VNPIDAEHRGVLDDSRTAALPYDTRALVEQALQNNEEAKAALDAIDHFEATKAGRLQAKQNLDPAVRVVEKMLNQKIYDLKENIGETIITQLTGMLVKKRPELGFDMMQLAKIKPGDHKKLLAKQEASKDQHITTIADVLIYIAEFDESDRTSLAEAYYKDHHQPFQEITEDKLETMVNQLKDFLLCTQAKEAFSCDTTSLYGAVRGAVC